MPTTGPATSPVPVCSPVDEPVVVPVLPLAMPPPVMVRVNWSPLPTRPTMSFCADSEPLKVQLARSLGVPEIPLCEPRSVMMPVLGLTE